MSVLKIKQGATYGFGFTWRRAARDAEGNLILDPQGNPTPGEPYDLTGCSARMQIRRKKGDPILVTATSAEPDNDAAIAAGAGRIKLESAGPDGNPRPGHIRVTLTDLDTQALTVRAGVFDLEVEWPQLEGELRPRVDRPLQGTVEVDLNITEG